MLPAPAAGAAPSRPSARRRPGPILIGAIIAALGLVLGGIATSYAVGSLHAYARRLDPQRDPGRKQDQGLLRHGQRHVSEHRDGDHPCARRQLRQGDGDIESNAQNYLRGVLADPNSHGPNPAVVFDIDDTTLNTYDYELYVNFAYTPASNEMFVDNEAFPSVYGMPRLVNWAEAHGLAVFFLTGRPEAQRQPTEQNLQNVGYHLPDDSHIFLKQPTPPSYLHCSAAPTCTTIEYKSGTRAHIENDLGYSIVADFGDQYSDLLGGHAGHKVKIPNPMYYLP